MDARFVTPTRLLLPLLLSAFAVVPAAAAGEDEGSDPRQRGPVERRASGGPGAPEDDDEDVFVPRADAPPARRTGGAPRVGKFPGPTVSILAPAESLGLTGREQPVIYWALSEDTELPLWITIDDPRDGARPTLDIVVEGPKEAGVHKLDLARVRPDGRPVKLEPGVEYAVALNLVQDKRNAANNPAATARLRRVGPADVPAEAKRERDPAKLARAYGKAGLWFDFIAALNAAIAAKPKDEALLRTRAKALAAQRLVWRADGTIAEVPTSDARGQPK